MTTTSDNQAGEDLGAANAELVGDFPALLAELGIVGGAVYDSLVGLAARSNSLALATRDVRAAATYSALGVDVTQIVGEDV